MTGTLVRQGTYSNPPALTRVFDIQPQHYVRPGGRQRYWTEREFRSIVRRMYGRWYKLEIGNARIGKSRQIVARCPLHAPFSRAALQLIRGAECPACRRIRRDRGELLGQVYLHYYFKRWLAKFGLSEDIDARADLYLRAERRTYTRLRKTIPISRAKQIAIEDEIKAECRRLGLRPAIGREGFTISPIVAACIFDNVCGHQCEAI